jgi:hypothetical protein
MNTSIHIYGSVVRITVNAVEVDMVPIQKDQPPPLVEEPHLFTNTEMVLE